MAKSRSSLIIFTVLLAGQNLVNATFLCINWPSFNKTSCNEALERLAAPAPGETGPIAWMARGEGSGNITPARYLSCMSQCPLPLT